MTVKKGPADERNALFDGNGTVRVWNLLSSRPATPFTAVLSCELEPGGSVGKHLQERDTEIVVGVGGQGQVRVDGAEQPLAAGDVAYVPRGSVLEIENLSLDAPLGYLIIKAAP